MAQTATETTATAQIAEAKSWLQKHERLIIVTLALIFGAYIGHGILNVMAKSADLRVQQATTQLNDQKTVNTQLAAQVQAATAQYQQIIAQVTARNAQLAETIAQRNTALTQQQKMDQTLPPSQIGNRMAALVGFDPSNVQATANSLSLTDDAATATIQQLELVPVLQANLSDTQTEETNTKTALAAANTLVGQQKDQITGLQLQITDGQNACKVEVADVKAQARKSKLRYFGVGFVTGFVAGHIW